MTAYDFFLSSPESSKPFSERGKWQDMWSLKNWLPRQQIRQHYAKIQYFSKILEFDIFSEYNDLAQMYAAERYWPEVPSNQKTSDTYDPKNCTICLAA